MRARGKRWELEPGYTACACGVNAAVLRNLKSGERRMTKHLAPSGAPCPEFEWQEAVERTRRIVDAALEGP